MALSEYEVLKLMDIAARRHLALMTDHTYVFSPAVRAIRRIVKSHEPGAVESFVSVRTNAATADQGVDVLWDLAIHDISILDFLFALPTLAVCVTGSVTGPSPLQSRATIEILFASGLHARIEVDWFAGKRFAALRSPAAHKSWNSMNCSRRQG